MAPTKQAPVVLARAPREDREAAARRQLRLLTWGLVPSWSKDARSGARIAEKPAFARALAARRCLVPARGWYEWQASPTAVDPKGRPRKQPFFTARADGSSVAMAGLYEFWRDPVVTDADDPLAWLTTFAVKDLGVGFIIPVGQLIVFLVLAIVVGVVGAVAPARRASRLQILDAVRSE